MRALVRGCIDPLLDALRERVCASDFAGDSITRVLVAPGFDEPGLAAVRRLFPGASVWRLPPRPSVLAARRGRFDAVCLPMSGGNLRGRAAALLSGARHTLLIPSPDYVYRLGNRRGPAALLWALVDRVVLAPIALLWLGILALGMGLSGLIGRAAGAADALPEIEGREGRPPRLLVIRLMPTSTFVSLLRRLRRSLPGAHLTALLASEDGLPEVQAVCADAITPGGGLGAVAQRVRGGGFDRIILAGGADYGLRQSYLKAVALALLAPGADRRQWEIGEHLAGSPLGQAVLTAAGRFALARLGRGEAGRRPGPMGRLRLRRRYAREPGGGPAIVQIGLTKACNYHCLFCPFHNPEADAGHHEADLPRLSVEVFDRLLGELRRAGTRSVDICGDGEPLMHPEALDMIALARAVGLDVTLATNAALLTEERARRLVDLGVRRMHVSFNAATDGVYERLHPGAPPGTRARIIGLMRGMAEYAEAEGLRPIDVEFSAVLNRLNMHQVPLMVEAARQARASWFMLILMGPAQGADELLPRLEDWILIRHGIERAAARAREYGIRTNLDAIRPGASAAGTRGVYQRIPCYIGHEYALVTGDGSVLFCCQCTRALGNLHQDSFRRIWYSEAYRQARRQARELPMTRAPLPGCECFTACSHVVVNLDVHRRLYGERGLW